MASKNRSNEQKTPGNDADDDTNASKAARREEVIALLNSGRVNTPIGAATLMSLLALDNGSTDAEAEDDSDNLIRRVGSDSSLSNKDAILGLKFTNGRTVYCHRSTLVNAGGYFAACFGDNGIPAVPLCTDESGQSIYFVERDGELFSDYILPFILNKIPGKLPPFFKDPELWRMLRSEVSFYALDDLSELLQVTHSCPYTKGEDTGVLHWLGTGKGKHKYRNPHSIRAVKVTVGGLQDATYEQQSELFARVEGGSINPQAYTLESKQALVQYRPQVIGCFNREMDSYKYSALHPCHSLLCHLSVHKFPTVIDLVAVKLRLTAYSLRQDQCGMTDWNLEGSEDGESWSVLHEARNDRSIAKIDAGLREKWEQDLRRCTTVDEKVAVTLEFAERERRHIWEVAPSPNVFYRCFRIIGSGLDYDRHEDSSSCLHGVGLELYGDVHEA